MCETTELVPIPALLWNADAIHTFDAGHPEYGIDGEGRRCLRLDACIVPVVQKLWAAGVVTLSCCCGHGDPWGVITIQTQAGVGQRGAMVMRVERYEALVAAESDLAAANATIAAQSLALATLREACLEDHTEDHLYLGGYLCRLCGHDVAPDVPEEHAKSCVLYSDGDQPASDAAALAGAVLAAADLLKHRWDRLCECVNEFEPEDMAACGEYRDRLDDAILGVIRARAALRGHGAVEG